MSTATSKQARAERLATLVGEIRAFIAGAILTNQRIAERMGLNPTDQQVLNLLDLSGGATPGKLAGWTALTTGGITVALDRLEKAGYVARERNPDDRRSIIVRANAAKLRQAQSHYKAINAGLAQLFGRYSDAEVDTILDFFVKSNALRGQSPHAEAGQH